MKKSLIIILLSLFALAILPSCRSNKEISTITPELTVKETRWRNVNVPVKLEVTEPQRITIAGRLSMVRNEYALISLRMLGFEVGQIYVTPEEADVIVKQVNKVWIQEPLADRLKALNVPFVTLQEALLGNQEAIDALPAGLGLSLSGSKEKPVLTLKLSPKGKPLVGSMTVNLNEAEWDATRVGAFYRPKESEYKKVSLRDLLKSLK